MPRIKERPPLKACSATNGVPQDVREDGLPQEIPPNHAPLPEIASSDQPQPCYELLSSDPAIQDQVHPIVSQPGRPGVRPHSASNLTQSPQPYGLAFRPHSPSQLSVVSSLGNFPPLVRGLSPVSITNDDISADV